MTATREAVGPADHPDNIAANEKLEADLKARGLKYQIIRGSYEGIDQGKNFLVTGLSHSQAQRLGAKYGQKSVLVKEGLLYRDNTLNPADPAKTIIGAAAKKEPFYSSIPGGPAFVMGIDFDKKVPFQGEAPQAKKTPRSGEPEPPNYSPAGNPGVQKVADEYLKAKHIAEPQHTGYAEVNEPLAKRVADWYQDAKHEPADPAVQKAYAAFADETVQQFNTIQAAGVTMEPWAGKGEPYKNSAAMMADVKDNSHLWFLPTRGNYGDETVTDHPLLHPSGIEVNGKSLPVNDVFRAVHDYFGHAKGGYGFGPRGEYNAFLSHIVMYSKEARPAMAAETMGQNSWVNYGAHLRTKEGNIPKQGEPGFVAAPERPFAKQKAAGMPDKLVQESARPGGAPQFSPASKNDESSKNAPVFYSQLEKVVESKFSGAQMPAPQLAAILRNPQSGVRRMNSNGAAWMISCAGKAVSPSKKSRTI